MRDVVASGGIIVDGDGMLTADNGVDGAAAHGDTAVVRSGRRRSLLILVAAVLAGALIFGAGVLAADRLGDDRGAGEAVDQTNDAIVLAQLGTLSQQADTIIGQAQQTQSSDVAAMRDLGVELQILAVAMGDLPLQAATEDLRGVSKQVADAYLKLSIGMVTNNGAQTSKGAAELTDSRDALAAYLGIEQADGGAEQESGAR